MHSSDKIPLRYCLSCAPQFSFFPNVILGIISNIKKSGKNCTLRPYTHPFNILLYLPDHISIHVSIHQSILALYAFHSELQVTVHVTPKYLGTHIMNCLFSF